MKEKKNQQISQIFEMPGKGLVLLSGNPSMACMMER